MVSQKQEVSMLDSSSIVGVHHGARNSRSYQI